MARRYKVAFQNIAVTAAQDLFEITPADDKPVKLISLVVSVRDSETNEQFTCSINHNSGGFTSGSGGGTITPVRTNPVDSAAGFTCERNNTTRITGGTQVLLHAEGWPSQGGFAYHPIPGSEPVASQGEALTVGLENAPGASTAFNGVAELEEMP